MAFIRERTITIGKYVETDIIPRTAAAEIAVRSNRGRKREVSRPAQQNLNNKNSHRYFTWLLQGNFENGDYYMTYTYKPKFKPKTIGGAQKEIKNWLGRLRRKAKKTSVELKYMIVTEFTEEGEAGDISNIHHHVIIKKGLNAEEIIDTWSKGRGKNREPIGIVHFSLIQSDSDGLLAIANYLSKQKRWKKGCKSWSSSKNLNRPFLSIDDHDRDYSKRKVEALALSNDGGEEFFRRKYKNYRITHIECKYYELTGWHIYLRAWRDSGDDEGGSNQ
ncbi:rolling circle replication-associated protein [Enterococcus sp. BWR-S5]|uniref:rolling circle replication-associated protein n=1 Tax=Enterococcus sp. BWR-S5 TaxID=2787714 RepID=UPI0019234BC8|nr:hypothetical protein [Enterococcus sp. BWR-S5]MBL1226587.1 hypothetical protein [Enterococcus sp. BWR-S5]